jgi:hypothetical protein
MLRITAKGGSGRDEAGAATLQCEAALKSHAMATRALRRGRHHAQQQKSSRRGKIDLRRRAG